MQRNIKRKLREQQIKIPMQQAPVFETGALFTESARSILEKYREENVNFSWHFFDRSHEYFNCGSADIKWFLSLIDTLKNVSQIRMKDFLQESRKPLRVHAHDWSRVIAKYPLNQNYFDEISTYALRFSVSTGRGRVHGFHIFNVFYIVWLDPLHNMYPENRPIKCDPPDDCYDCYSAELLQLEEERLALNTEFDNHFLEIEQLKNKNDIY